MKYQIGDIVWRATHDVTEKWVTCPDCGGTKTLKATLFEGTEYIIPCANCACGYEPPKGMVRIYQREPKAHKCEITGAELRRDGEVEYKSAISNCQCYILNEKNVFATEEEAMARANELAEEFANQENERIYKKTKDAKSWAWHVKHHRECAAKAQRDLDYHTQKLNFAKSKAKEPTP